MCQYWWKACLHRKPNKLNFSDFTSEILMTASVWWPNFAISHGKHGTRKQCFKEFSTCHASPNAICQLPACHVYQGFSIFSFIGNYQYNYIYYISHIIKIIINTLNGGGRKIDD